MEENEENKKEEIFLNGGNFDWYLILYKFYEFVVNGKIKLLVFFIVWGK